MANTVAPAAQNHVMNGSAKCWIKFRGTSTVVVRDSFNVSSLTDNGTGRYTVNINSNMSNIHYSVTYKAGNFYDGANSIREVETPTTTAGTCQLYGGATTTALADVPAYFAHMMGDYA